MPEDIDIAQTTGDENEDRLVRAGDVNVLAVELWSSQHQTPISLADVWLNISIFEDINNPFIEGEITIPDSGDLLSSLPIMGNEKIRITFSTPSNLEPRVVIGQIVSITGQTQLTQAMKVYVLGFVSPEFVFNQKTQFSKSYNKMLISDMVQDIHSQFIFGINKKPLKAIPSTSQTSRVIPTFSPFKAIDWLSKWAVTRNYPDGVSYVFFESKDTYFFGPVESLIDVVTHRTPAAVYTRTNVNAQANQAKNVAAGFYTIQSISESPVEVMDDIVHGLYASLRKEHDIVLRTISDTNFNYFDEYSKTTHLESNIDKTMLHNDLNLGEYPNSFIVYATDHFQAFTGQGSRNVSNSQSLIRNSQMQQFFARRLDIVIPGDSDRTIGEVVQLDIPNASPMIEDNEGELDRYLSGRYLITSLRHSIDRSADNRRSTYSISMEVSKDSVKTPYPDQIKTGWS